MLHLGYGFDTCRRVCLLRHVKHGLITASIPAIASPMAPPVVNGLRALQREEGLLLNTPATEGLEESGQSSTLDATTW